MSRSPASQCPVASRPPSVVFRPRIVGGRTDPEEKAGRGALPVHHPPSPMMVECPPPAEVYPRLICTGIDTRNAAAASGPKKWSSMDCPCRPSSGVQGKDKVYPDRRKMQEDSAAR